MVISPAPGGFPLTFPTHNINYLIHKSYLKFKLLIKVMPHANHLLRTSFYKHLKLCFRFFRLHLATSIRVHFVTVSYNLSLTLICQRLPTVEINLVDNYEQVALAEQRNFEE